MGLESKCSGADARAPRYSVQVASYINTATADARVTDLNARGFRFFSYAVNIPGKGRWYRVATEPYQSHKAARAAGMELKKRGVIKDFVLIKTVAGDTTGASKKIKPKDRSTPAKIAFPPKLKSTPVPASPKDKLLSPGMPKAMKTDLPAKSTEKITPQPIPLAGRVEAVAPQPVPLSGRVEAVAPQPVPLARSAETILPRPLTENKEAVTRAPANNVHDSAMRDFINQRYEDALSKFEALAAAGGKETTLRRIADCYYFSGRKGNNRYLLKATEQYREIIKKNPAAQRENAQALYRLADSYRLLNFSYEALAEFNALCLKHPESIYVPDAFFMAGKMAYQVERFSPALQTFKTYIKKYPDGKYEKAAYFAVGACYSKLRQLNDAKIWYENALKKWPVMEDLPEDWLSQLGEMYYMTRKYDEALAVFVVYLNLYPEGRAYKDTLCKVADSFEKTGRLPMALKISSLIIKRFPDTREARQSAFLMATIGTANPTLKLPHSIFTGRDYFRDPISAYDTMAEKKNDPKMAEELAFRKMMIQYKKGMYRQTFDTGHLLLDKFPSGTYRKKIEENLVLSAGHLLDDLYSKKDYIAVAQLYFQSTGKILLNDGDFGMLLNIATALKEIGLGEQAIAIFQKMRSKFPTDRRINEPRLAEAQINYSLGRTQEAREILETLLAKASEQNRETMQRANGLMGEICFREHRFKEANRFYLSALPVGETTADMAVMRKRYADSLKETDRDADALKNYLMVLETCAGDSQKCPDALMMGSYEGAGDCLYDSGSIREAISMHENALRYKPLEADRRQCILFKIGRDYARLDDTALAEKSFGLVKNDTDNAFWSTIVDHYLTHKNWTEKYGEYL